MQNNAYQRNITFDDAYLELDNTTIDGQFEQAIELSIALSIRHEVYNKMIRQLTTFDHHCYECRKPITVDVSRILKFNDDLSTESFLCDIHKNDHDVSERSIPFVKYKNVFIQKLTSHLLNATTKTEHLCKLKNLTTLM